MRYNCYNCPLSRIDNNNITCHYFETPYVVMNPYFECKLAESEEMLIEEKKNGSKIL